MAKRNNWRMRKDRPPRDCPADVDFRRSVQRTVAAAKPELPAIADRLEAAVEKELAAVETMRAKLGTEPSVPADAERTARTLERLTETLSKVRRLRISGDAPATDITPTIDIPRDIDEFRHALAIRIEIFARSWPRRAVSQTGAAGGANPSQS
jgi:hypothetical protein